MNDENEGRGVVIRHDFGGLAQVKEHGASTSGARCRHMSTVVDEVSRTVACHTCGAPLDAITVLLEYARGERLWRGWETEMRRTQDKLAELEAEERKVKARTKAASRKDADVAVEAERARTEKMRTDITEQARDIARMCQRIEHLARRGKQ